MKKLRFLLGLSCLISLIGCNSSKKYNKYENCYYFYDEDMVAMKVSYVQVHYESGSIEPIIDKEYNWTLTSGNSWLIYNKRENSWLNNVLYEYPTNSNHRYTFIIYL